MPSFIDLPQKEEFSETIDEIIKLRSKRKYTFETNINNNATRKKALGILKERLDFLRQSARELYSTVSSINNRAFFTEDPDFIKGEVKPNAPVGDYEIEILKLGDKQLLISDPLPDKITLPESRIEIEIKNEKIFFDFQGGDAKSFVRNLNKVCKGYFTANWIRKSEDESYFVVQANQIGEAYRFNLRKDSNEIFATLKLLKAKPPIIKTFIDIKSLTEIGWAPYKEENIAGVIIPPSVMPDLNFSNHIEVGSTVPNQGIEPGVMPLDLTVDFIETQHVFLKIDILSPQSLFKNNKVETNLGHGESNGLSISHLNVTNEISKISNQHLIKSNQEKIIQELKIQNKPIMVLEYFAEGEERTKTFTWNNVYDDRIWINDSRLGAGLDKTVVFRSIKFINDSKYSYIVGKWFRSLYNTNQDKYLPVNEKSSPSKVEFRFYSIDMERESAIVDDLIDGVTLNLLKVKDEPVRFSVQNYIEGYNQQIKNFVGQYNYALDFINLSLAPGKEELVLDQIESGMEAMIGVFDSETSIQRLKDKMKEILQKGYLLKENEREVYLQEVGIKVFNSLSKPYHINASKVELDEERLQTQLLKHGDEIKNLFRYDQNKDYVPDDGFAYLMDKLLREYLAPNSIFTLMERSLDKEKDSLEKSLDAEQKRINSYREKLESDFAKVKQVRERQKQLEKWLKTAGE